MRVPLVLMAILMVLALAGGPVGATAPPNPVLDLARAREAADDPAGAAADLSRYVAQHPLDVAAIRLLGDLYFRIPDPHRAEAAWKRALALHSSDPETHVRLGALYSAEGRVRDAIVQYDADMPNASAAVALIRLHTRNGDLDQFLNDIADSAERNRFDPDVLLVQATVLHALHRDAEALGYYTRVVELHHGDCDDLIDRADDLFAMRRNAEAVADLQRCLAQQPNSYDALVLLATGFLAEGDVTDARPWVARALAVNPSGYAALVDRGVIEDDDGQSPAAMRDDEAAIAIEPLRSEGYANLAYDLLERHAVHAAEATILAGLRAVPEDGRLHYLLARTYQLEGKSLALTRAQFVAALSSDEEIVIHAAQAQLRTLSGQ
jgi:tetratricopeptide (TPR) repeat protein